MGRQEIESLFRRAVELHHGGRIVEAQELYREILGADSRHVDAQYLFAASLLQMKRTEEAIERLKKLLRERPYHADGHATLGEAYLSRDCFSEAVGHFEQAITLKPGQGKVFMNLGTAWQRSGDYEKAIACLGQAVKLNPQLAEGYFNLGNLFRELGQFDGAVGYYRRAIELRAGFAEAHSNLGYTLKASGQLEGALGAFGRAHAIEPGNAAIHSGIVYLMQFAPGKSSREILAAHREWYEKHAAGLAGTIWPHVNERSSARRLKIGYVSPDFRDHCQSFFTLPLFEHHDHERFEIWLYSDVVVEDGVTRRIKKAADHFCCTAGLTHAGLAEKIRGDGIDILVDLTMHMAGSRLLCFAEKPAPVQVSWLAYPGTTGLPTMDYRFSDPYLDPVGSEIHYVEKTIRLPETFWCYDPLAEMPEPGEPPRVRNGYLTFGCLNNFCKVNDEVLEVWARVMNAVGDAKLILLCPEGAARRRVLEVFSRRGVAAERVEFTGALPREKYLELYRGIDVALDTFPYNGHTTTLDGLWMGVPVITLVGETVVGRAGLSQLTNLGMAEFVAYTKEEYVGIAERVGRAPGVECPARGLLRASLENSPLRDGVRFAGHVESAYRDMWRQYCGEK